MLTLYLQVPSEHDEVRDTVEASEYSFNILAAVIQLDQWILTANSIPFENDDRGQAGQQDHDIVESLLPADEVYLWSRSGPPSGPHQLEEIRRFARGMSKADAIRRILDLRTLPYIRWTFQDLITLHDVRVRQIKYTARTSNVRVPRSLKLNESEYIDYCGRGFDQTRARLTSLYVLTMDLRQNIIDAALYSPLNMHCLQALKQRMQQIEHHFEPLCVATERTPFQLVSGTERWW